MSDNSICQRAEAVRRFNRFYTKQIGVLHEGLLKSSFSLTEARVMYELAHHGNTTGTQLVNELSLDAGYLSRIIRNFKEQRLIDKQPSPTDGRQYLLSLTDQGREVFSKLNAASQQEIEAMLSTLSAAEQSRLTEAMHTIEALLGTPPDNKEPHVLRPHQPGDMGWVVHRHGVFYAQEYGWDEEFEALVADIVVKFIQNFDPKRERCWIAERYGERVGSIFLMKESDTLAKLRLLLIEPQARGFGLGRRLIAECLRFARQVGYQKATLWTNSDLLAARHLYQQAGFVLVNQEPQHSFGDDWISETWELEL